ncbi:alpha/beta fold hydrolase [Paraburkholderia guartelaensis]|uniref:alpha/beta fold hydrolase n=1 Tax=Paraburkholderia guartelaensis TaxID=2546446 RepID=UPI002AB65913|nr:alpha/beta hydrolase [Paraburkholderia guartelaensis]
MTDAAESFHEISGCRVRVMRGGKGEPLLFLHGARGATHWVPFMQKLAERYDVIVPEHPGFGGSDTPAWLDNVSDLAYFYLDFLKHFGLDSVRVVGNSLGGWIASEMAVRNTGAIRSVVLIAPAGIHVKGVQKGDIFMWNREETAYNLFYNPEFAKAALAVEPNEADIDTMLKNNLMTAKLTWQPRLYNPDLYKWMHRIDVPVQVIWGNHDKVIPVDYAAAFQALIPGSRLKVITNCGHLPHIEKADEVLDTIADFEEVTQ